MNNVTVFIVALFVLLGVISTPLADAWQDPVKPEIVKVWINGMGSLPYTLPADVRKAMASEKLPGLRIAPVAGMWAKYRFTVIDSQTNEPRSEEITFAVDAQTNVDGNVAWWFEIITRSPNNNEKIYTRYLYNPLANKLHRLMYKLGGNPVVELHESKLPEQSPGTRIGQLPDNAVKETSETITVNGKKFEVTWYREGEGIAAKRIAFCEKAPPLGIVIAERPEGRMELVEFGSDWKSFLDMTGLEIVGAP